MSHALGPRLSAARAGLAWIGASIAVLWVVLLWWAPAHVAGRDSAAAAAARAIYAAGAVLCHQRPARSFVRLGQPLPVCGRCTGVYAGAAIGWLVAAVWRPRRAAPARHYRRLLAGAGAAPLATVALEWFGLAPVGNLARAATAVPIGAAVGWMLVVALLAGDERPAHGAKVD